MKSQTHISISLTPRTHAALRTLAARLTREAGSRITVSAIVRASLAENYPELRAAVAAEEGCAVADLGCAT